MPGYCSECGKSLRSEFYFETYSRPANYIKCIVCGLNYCLKCAPYLLCPTDFSRFSTEHQEYIKKYYRKRPFIKANSKLQEIFKLFSSNPNKKYSVDDIILQTGSYPKYIGNVLYQLRLNGYIKEVSKIGHKKIYQLIS